MFIFERILVGKNVEVSKPAGDPDILSRSLPENYRGWKL